MLIAKKIFSFFLIILVVGYSGGINIAKHLCNGEVVAKALNHQVKICKKAQLSSPSRDHSSFSKKSCCDTEFSLFNSDTFSKINVGFEFLKADITFETTFLLEVLSEDTSEKDYSHPQLHRLPIYDFIEKYLI
jgi:hypothetical protein